MRNTVFNRMSRIITWPRPVSARDRGGGGASTEGGGIAFMALS